MEPHKAGKSKNRNSYLPANRNQNPVIRQTRILYRPKKTPQNTPKTKTQQTNSNCKSQEWHSHGTASSNSSGELRTVGYKLPTALSGQSTRGACAPYRNLPVQNGLNWIPWSNHIPTADCECSQTIKGSRTSLVSEKNILCTEQSTNTLLSKF